MRVLIFTVINVLLAATSAQGQDTTRVLFLGNSYTYFNELPVMLSELAASMGHVVETSQNTPGGASLQGHMTNDTSQDLIQQGDWDFVVLQEQSQKASLPYDQVQADFFPAVQALADEIRNHNDCAVPLLYMTWGRENGDDQNCSWWPPVCTYEGMQELLTERYLEAADMTESWCAPVGMIWEDVVATTGLDLYNPDSSHPSAAGSYLAASAFFVAIFGENPMNSEYSGPIGLNESEALDEAVWNVWQNQQSAWKQFDLLGTELFSQSTPTGSIVQVSTSPYVDSIAVSNATFDFIWMDGDLVTLDFEGTTTLELVVYSACGPPYSYSETLTSAGNSVSATPSPLGTQVYPNPAHDVLFVELNWANPAHAILRDSNGRQTKEWPLSGATCLDVSAIPSGFYRLEIWSQGALLNSRAIAVQR